MVKKKSKGKSVNFQKIGKEIDKGIKKGCCDEISKKPSKCGSGSCGYGLGFIGAAVYYISTATGFWMGVWGFIKAILWPAFLVYEALKFMIS